MNLVNYPDPVLLSQKVPIVVVCVDALIIAIGRLPNVFHTLLHL